MTTYSYDDGAEGMPPLPVLADRQRSLQAIVTNISSRLRATEDKTRDQSNDIAGLQKEMKALTAAVERGNRILVGLLVSAVLGSTSVTMAILLSTAKKGFHLP